MNSIILGDLAMTSAFVVMQNKIGPGLTFFFLYTGVSTTNEQKTNRAP